MSWMLFVLLAVGLFAFYVSRRPDSFSFQRSIEIKATPQRIFPMINDLHEMNSWNPYAAADPKAVLAYEGPSSGKSAVYTWAGGKMGEGRYEITESIPYSAVKARLLMIKPLAADNEVEYTLTPGNGTTVVIWAMRGKNKFIHKLMQTVFSMDKMVGKDFEKGLAALKAKAEA